MNMLFIIVKKIQIKLCESKFFWIMLNSIFGALVNHTKNKSKI
jgi:hypothetical protein